MNIDTQTVHDLVTRQIDLLRYERSVRRDVLKQLAQMQAEVEGRLKRKDLSELTRRELNALLTDIDTILSRDYDLIADRLKTEQAAAVEDESAWLWAWLAALAVSQQAEPKPLSETAVKSLSDGLLVGGLTVAEAIAGQKAALMQQIKQAVRVAAVSGADAAADVADLFKRKARDLTAVTATWIGTLSAEVHYAFGKVNPLVKGFRHVSVLDGKTSSVCTARHGLVWDKNHNPIGHSYPFRRPALHPHCRSKLVFVFDLDSEFEGVTGEDWVKGRTLEQLQEQFGKGVGEMLHKRIITLNDAVRSDGLQAATLKELQDKYAVPETVRVIERKRWSPEFKAKAKALYLDFRDSGIELDSHAIARILDRTAKAKPHLNADEVKQFILDGKPDYLQEDGRLVWISVKMNATFIQAQDGVFVTVMRKSKAKKEWKPIN